MHGYNFFTWHTAFLNLWKAHKVLKCNIYFFYEERGTGAQKANFRTLDREPIVMPKKFVHMNVGMRRQNRGLWAGRLFSNIRDIT